MKAPSAPHLPLEIRAHRLCSALVLLLLASACSPWVRRGERVDYDQRREIYLGHRLQGQPLAAQEADGVAFGLEAEPRCRVAEWGTRSRVEERALSPKGTAGGVFAGVGGFVALIGGVGFLAETLSPSEVGAEDARFAYGWMAKGGGGVLTLGLGLILWAVLDEDDTVRKTPLAFERRWSGAEQSCGPTVSVPGLPEEIVRAHIEAPGGKRRELDQRLSVPGALRLAAPEWRALSLWLGECAYSPSAELVLSLELPPGPYQAESPPPARAAPQEQPAALALKPLRLALQAVPGVPLEELEGSPLAAPIRKCIAGAAERCAQGRPRSCEQALRYTTDAEQRSTLKARWWQLQESLCRSGGAEACDSLAEQSPGEEDRARFVALAGQARAERAAREDARRRQSEAAARRKAESEARRAAQRKAMEDAERAKAAAAHAHYRAMVRQSKATTRTPAQQRELNDHVVGGLRDVGQQLANPGQPVAPPASAQGSGNVAPPAAQSPRSDPRSVRLQRTTHPASLAQPAAEPLPPPLAELPAGVPRATARGPNREFACKMAREQSRQGCPGVYDAKGLFTVRRPVDLTPCECDRPRGTWRCRVTFGCEEVPRTKRPSGGRTIDVP